MENHSEISKNFVPYKLAVKLKELGFNSKSLGFSYMEFNCEGVSNATFEKVVPNYLYDDKDLLSIAPTYSQAFDWFREKHNYHYEIFLTSDSPYDKFHYRVMEIGKYFTLSYDNFEGTYEEARQACLEKLIELCNKII